MESEGSKHQTLSDFSSPGSLESNWALTLPESVSEGILVVDNTGVIRYANSQAGSLFGWDPAELLGQIVELLLPPALTQIHKGHREEYLQQPVPKLMGIGRDLQGRRKDGSLFPIEISLSPYSTGASTYILCLITDISKWVKTTANLRLSLEQFESLFKAFPLPTYVWQHQENDFILVNYNDADQPSTNATIKKFFGRRIRNMFPKGSQMVIDIERCFQEKGSFSREYKRYRVPYTREIKDLNVTYIFCEPDLVMVIYDDMTVLHKTINELKKLSSAVEQTADAVFITDKDGIIEYANLGFEQMTGFTRAEAVGNNPRIIKSGQMPPAYYEMLWKTLLGGEAFQSQTINRRRNGEIFIAEQTITPMKDSEGKATHFVSVLKDMTDRIQSQELETEHRLAGRIQKQLFPIHTPEIPGYDIAGAVFPARHTSGDCFDFISMPQDSLGIVVADVCDHGMGSALIMAKTQAHLHSIMHYESNPINILRELNRQMQPDLLDSMYITIFLAILDPQRHLLEHANAGNTPTFILDQHGEVIHELRTDGFPIGIVPDLELRPREPILLPPGSVTVFLTDGVHETFGENGNQFGFQRLLEVIRRHRLAPALEIIDRLKDAVQEFSGFVERTDDQTIIICKRVG